MYALMPTQRREIGNKINLPTLKPNRVISAARGAGKIVKLWCERQGLRQGQQTAKAPAKNLPGIGRS